MSAIARFVRAVDALNEGVGRLIALFLLVLIGLVVFEVTLRYGLKSPTTWGGELIGYIFATYILLGGGYALLHRDHVNMDIFYARFTPRGRAIADVVTAGFVFLYCYVLMREGALMALDAYQTGRRASTDWGPPLFPVLIMLPVGAGLLLLQALAKFLRDLVFAITGRELIS
jgi:TRAP-type mannitol/chloroaromatic compound transport system permease small subunit